MDPFNRCWWQDPREGQCRLGTYHDGEHRFRCHHQHPERGRCRRSTGHPGSHRYQ